MEATGERAGQLSRAGELIAAQAALWNASEAEEGQATRRLKDRGDPAKIIAGAMGIPLQRATALKNNLLANRPKWIQRIRGDEDLRLFKDTQELVNRGNRASTPPPAADAAVPANGTLSQKRVWNILMSSLAVALNGGRLKDAKLVYDPVRKVVGKLSANGRRFPDVEVQRVIQQLIECESVRWITAPEERQQLSSTAPVLCLLNPPPPEVTEAIPAAPPEPPAPAPLPQTSSGDTERSPANESGDDLPPTQPATQEVPVNDQLASMNHEQLLEFFKRWQRGVWMTDNELKLWRFLKRQPDASVSFDDIRREPTLHGVPEGELLEALGRFVRAYIITISGRNAWQVFAQRVRVQSIKKDDGPAARLLMLTGATRFQEIDRIRDVAAKLAADDADADGCIRFQEVLQRGLEIFGVRTPMGVSERIAWGAYGLRMFVPCAERKGRMYLAPTSLSGRDLLEDPSRDDAKRKKTKRIRQSDPEYAALHAALREQYIRDSGYVGEGAAEERRSVAQPPVTQELPPPPPQQPEPAPVPVPPAAAPSPEPPASVVPSGITLAALDITLAAVQEEIAKVQEAQTRLRNEIAGKQAELLHEQGRSHSLHHLDSQIRSIQYALIKLGLNEG